MGPPPQAPKPPRPPRSGRKRHPFRWILALVALYLAYLVAVPLWFLLAGNQFDATPSGERPPEQPGTTLLLVGSDAKKDDTAGSRTDSIMVLYVPTTVEIPGRKQNKLNAAYAFGGPTLLVQTVEQNTGLRMDGVIEVSMAGFPALVDAVGGIELCLDKPMKDKDSKADFPAGCQQFDGAKALAYTRMRKADPLGDLGRIKRQREVIGKVVGQALSPSSLLPWQWWSLWEAGTSVVQRSSDTSLATLARSGMALGKLGSGGMLQGTVPVSNTNASTPAGSSVLWDNAKAKQLFAQLATGDTTGVEQYLK